MPVGGRYAVAGCYMVGILVGRMRQEDGDCGYPFKNGWQCTITRNGERTFVTVEDNA